MSEGEPIGWGEDSDPRIYILEHRIYRRIVGMAESLISRINASETEKEYKESLLKDVNETMDLIANRCTTRKNTFNFKFQIGQSVEVAFPNKTATIGIIIAQVHSTHGEFYMTDVTDVELISVDAIRSE